MKMKRIIRIAIVVLLIAPVSALARNPGSQKWSVDMDSYISDSPAIGAEGVIYAGAGDALWAIDPDRAVRWTFSAGARILSSPAIDPDGTIYFGTEGDTLQAVDPDGSGTWAFSTGGDVNSTPAIGSDGVVYIGCNDKTIYAVNADGSLKWAYETGGPIYSSPTIGPDGVIYIGSNDDTLYAMYPDGGKKWAYDTGGDVYSTVAIDEKGVLYVGSDSGKLHALNPDGSRKWEYDIGSDVRSSPSIGEDGTIYVGAVGVNGGFYAVTPEGALKWKASIGDVNASSASVGADGVIYIGNTVDKFLYAIDPDGTTKWQFYSTSFVDSSPAIGADGVIYAGSDKLYAIYSESFGLAASTWPRFHGDNRNSGLVENLPLLLSHSLEFRLFSPGESIRATFEATNLNSQEIIIEDSGFDSPYFRLDPSPPAAIAPGAAETWTATVLADGSGLYRSEFSVTYRIGENPRNASISIGAGLFLDDGGELAHTARRAIAAYDSCLERDPDSPAAKNNLGVLHRLLRETSAAETDIQDALLDAMNDRSGYAGIKMNMGVVKSDQGLPDDATAFYDLAEDDLSSNKAESVLGPQIDYNKAWKAYRGDDFTTANELLEKVTDHDKANDFLKAKAFVLQGVVYHKQQKTNPAKYAFRRAVALDPEGPIGDMARGNLSPPTCLSLDDGLNLAIRAELNGEEFVFTLVFSTEAHDTPGLYWKLDMNTLAIHPTPSEGCLKFDKNLALPVCLEYADRLFEFTLRFHPDADGQGGLYWKMDAGTIMEK